MNIKVKSSSTITVDDLCDAVNENCNEKQKLKIATSFCMFGHSYDMTFVERLLVIYAKICLKRIKKDKALYNRNRPYFNALKAIVKYKEAN